MRGISLALGEIGEQDRLQAAVRSSVGPGAGEANRGERHLASVPEKSAINGKTRWAPDHSSCGPRAWGGPLERERSGKGSGVGWGEGARSHPVEGDGNLGRVD